MLGVGTWVTSRRAHQLTVTLGAPPTPDEVPALCRAAEDIVTFMPVSVVRCDVGSVREPDASTLDAVARLALTARRVGAAIELVNACPGLFDLIDLAGLSDVVRLGDRRSGIEMGRQAELREQGVGVEEEVEADDGPT